jgi:hypothetical protein
MQTRIDEAADAKSSRNPGKVDDGMSNTVITDLKHRLYPEAEDKI